MVLCWRFSFIFLFFFLLNSRSVAHEVDPSLQKLLQRDAEGYMVSDFGRFDLYVCGGKRMTHSYLYLVVERDLKKHFIEEDRSIRFYAVDETGNAGGGITENIGRTDVFDIGSRSVYEVLPYDDKVIFVLVDGRAYDVLTFVCSGGGLQKVSEVVQPDDLQVEPGYPHSHGDDRGGDEKHR